jgi:hypothetical protein
VQRTPEHGTWPLRTDFTIHPGIGFKGAVQAEEAKQLTKFLANLPPANPSGQDYVIITGDFNSDPTSEAIGTAPPLQCCRSCNNLPHPLPGNMLKGDQIELTDSWPHCSYGVRSLLPVVVAPAMLSRLILVHPRMASHSTVPTRPSVSTMHSTPPADPATTR